jgi:CarD family transcriptional regulator
MHFSVGDKVVHPVHGSGRVTGVQHQELVEGFEHYYVLEIMGKGLTVFVPMRKAEELGVRPTKSCAELDHILGVLKKESQELPEDHKVRQGCIQEKLTSGSLVQVAEVVRDLTVRRQVSHLTRADRRLLDQGRDLLAAEMALVADSLIEDAHQVIDAELARVVADLACRDTDERRTVIPSESPVGGAGQPGLMDSLRRYGAGAMGLGVN